jgi:hypothetical protein
MLKVRWNVRELQTDHQAGCGVPSPDIVSGTGAGTSLLPGVHVVGRWDK